MPVIKQHNLTLSTVGMKNLYGILGGRRNRLHQAIEESIVDLAEFVRPTRAAVVGGAAHVFGGSAGTLADEASWPLLAVIVAGLLLAYASMQGVDSVVNRSFAVAVGVVGVAKLGLLIEDPVLRIVVAGIAVGVALVTAGSMLLRRRIAPEAPNVPVEGERPRQ